MNIKSVLSATLVAVSVFASSFAMAATGEMFFYGGKRTVEANGSISIDMAMFLIDQGNTFELYRMNMLDNGSMDTSTVSYAKMTVIPKGENMFQIASIESACSFDQVIVGMTFKIVRDDTQQYPFVFTTPFGTEAKFIRANRELTGLFNIVKHKPASCFY